MPSTGNSGNNTSLVKEDASRPHGGLLAESPPSKGVSAPEKDGVAEGDAKHVPEKGGGAVATGTEGEDDATAKDLTARDSGRQDSSSARTSGGLPKGSKH